MVDLDDEVDDGGLDEDVEDGGGSWWGADGAGCPRCGLDTVGVFRLTKAVTRWRTVALMLMVGNSVGAMLLLGPAAVAWWRGWWHV